MASVRAFIEGVIAGIVMLDCKDFHELCYNRAISMDKNTLYRYRGNKDFLW